MDKSWRDGIAFNALIHRIKPELIDMDIVHQNTPKANLEQVNKIYAVNLQRRIENWNFKSFETNSNSFLYKFL